MWITHYCTKKKKKATYYCANFTIMCSFKNDITSQIQKAKPPARSRPAADYIFGFKALFYHSAVAVPFKTDFIFSVKKPGVGGCGNLPVKGHGLVILA